MDKYQQGMNDLLNSGKGTPESVMSTIRSFRDDAGNPWTPGAINKAQTAVNNWQSAQEAAHQAEQDRLASYQDNTAVQIPGIGVLNQGEINKFMDNTKKDVMKAYVDTQVSDMKREASTPTSIYSRKMNKNSPQTGNQIVEAGQQHINSMLPTLQNKQVQEMAQSLQNTQATDKMANLPSPQSPLQNDKFKINMEKQNQILRNDYQRAMEEEWMNPIIEMTRTAPKNMTPEQQKMYLQSAIDGLKTTKGNPNTWTSRVAGFTPKESSTFDRLLEKGVTPDKVGQLNITNGRNMSLNPIDQEKFQKYYETIGGQVMPSYVEGKITGQNGKSVSVQQNPLAKELATNQPKSTTPAETTEEMIRRHEGFSTKPFWDNKQWTVGYGTALTPKQARQFVMDPSNPKSKTFDMKDSGVDFDAMFQEHYKKASDAATRMLPENAPEGLHQVLTGMAYQMGEKGTKAFKKMQKAIKAGDYEKAADEMLDSKWAKQTPERVKEMSELMRKIGKGEITPEQAEVALEEKGLGKMPALSSVLPKDKEGVSVERVNESEGAPVKELITSDGMPAQGKLTVGKDGKLESFGPGDGSYEDEKNWAGQAMDAVSEFGGNVAETFAKPQSADDLKWYNSKSFGNSLLRFGMGLLSGESLAQAFDNGAASFGDNFNREQRSMWASTPEAREKYSQEQLTSFVQKGDPKVLQREGGFQTMVHNGVEFFKNANGGWQPMPTQQGKENWMPARNKATGMLGEVNMTTGEFKHYDKSFQGGGSGGGSDKVDPRLAAAGASMVAYDEQKALDPLGYEAGMGALLTDILASKAPDAIINRRLVGDDAIKLKEIIKERKAFAEPGLRLLTGAVARDVEQAQQIATFFPMSENEFRDGPPGNTTADRKARLRYATVQAMQSLMHGGQDVPKIHPTILPKIINGSVEPAINQNGVIVGYYPNANSAEFIRFDNYTPEELNSLFPEEEKK